MCEIEEIRMIKWFNRGYLNKKEIEQRKFKENATTNKQTMEWNGIEWNKNWITKYWDKDKISVKQQKWIKQLGLNIINRKKSSFEIYNSIIFEESYLIFL